MADLAIIVPSRGRPQRFLELLEAIDRTAETDVRVIAAVDEDDESDYTSLIGRVFRSDPVVYKGARKSLSGWTNHLAMQVLQAPNPPRYLASLGDDHRPRTPAWDRLLVEAIEERGGSGFAYGNDLAQGPKLPTAWVVSADIVQALGWMMLPDCAHMYVDNATLALGQALDKITYCPDVIIEHLHPFVGKGQMDDSYRESNSAERYTADAAAFEAWKANGLEQDAATIRALLAVNR